MSNQPELTCIHQSSGLCPTCQEDYDTDPGAWYEFGQHPAGIARWEAECGQWAADNARWKAELDEYIAARKAAGLPEYDSEIPF